MNRPSHWSSQPLQLDARWDFPVTGKDLASFPLDCQERRHQHVQPLLWVSCFLLLESGRVWGRLPG
jgi:hypothetical protein